MAQYDLVRLVERVDDLLGKRALLARLAVLLELGGGGGAEAKGGVSSVLADGSMRCDCGDS